MGALEILEIGGIVVLTAAAIVWGCIAAWVDIKTNRVDPLLDNVDSNLDPCAEDPRTGRILNPDAIKNKMKEINSKYGDLGPR